MILPLPGNEATASALAGLSAGELGVLEVRRFPDQEAYVRLACDVAGKDVDLVCTLARPDAQFLSLVFAAATARELGARSIRLIAPYLAYMRQDQRFRAGEAVSSVHFARLVSQHFDGLVTVDPHLHRRQTLGEIYPIPTRVVHAAASLGDWIAQHVAAPLVIGPDRESEQWVSAVATRANAPYVVLSKQRLTDRDVRISVPDLSAWKDRRPVLVDDIISSGHTLLAAAAGLSEQGVSKPYCVAVHALFADNAYAQLLERFERVISTDTVVHPSNAIGIAALLAEQVAPD